MTLKRFYYGGAMLFALLVAGCTTTSGDKPTTPAAPIDNAVESDILERAARQIESHARTFAHTPLPIRSAMISGPTPGRFLLRGTESTEYCVQIVIESPLFPRGVNARVSIEQTTGPSKLLQVDIGSAVSCPGINSRPFSRLIELRKARLVRAEAAFSERLRTTPSSPGLVR